MNVRLFALLLILMAIAASIFATVMPKGADAIVDATAKNGMMSDVVVNPIAPAKRPPIGSIDGSVNPELIPDEVAYSLLFRLLSDRHTKKERAKIRSYIKQMNVTDADGLLAVVDEFELRVGKLDRKALKIHEKQGPNLDSVALAELNDLQWQKEKIVADLVQTLPYRIDANNMASIRRHINERVKVNVRMMPDHVHQ